MAAMFLIAELAVVAMSTVRPGPAQAATAPPGAASRHASDLKFILKQIKIAEAHVANTTRDRALRRAASAPVPTRSPARCSRTGLRTVDGSCNNLSPGQETFGAADQLFPRLTTPVVQRRRGLDGPPRPGRPCPDRRRTRRRPATSSTPSRASISNLIVDQTVDQPGGRRGGRLPGPDPGQPGASRAPVDAPTARRVSRRTACPSHETLFIPNVTTDVGLSPPYNSLFTFFGQFFDHGVDLTVKGGGTVFVPLRPTTR